MRVLVAKYRSGEILFWDAEMQETLENLPEGERPELLGYLTVALAAISELEPV